MHMWHPQTRSMVVLSALGVQTPQWFEFEVVSSGIGTGYPLGACFGLRNDVLDSETKRLNLTSTDQSLDSIVRIVTFLAISPALEPKTSWQSNFDLTLIYRLSIPTFKVLFLSLISTKIATQHVGTFTILSIVSRRRTVVQSLHEYRWKMNMIYRIGTMCS